MLPCSISLATTLLAAPIRERELLICILNTSQLSLQCCNRRLRTTLLRLLQPPLFRRRKRHRLRTRLRVKHNGFLQELTRRVARLRLGWLSRRRTGPGRSLVDLLPGLSETCRLLPLLMTPKEQLYARSRRWDKLELGTCLSM